MGQEPCGRLSFLKEPKTTKGLPQAAVCNLNITLPIHKKVRPLFTLVFVFFSSAVVVFFSSSRSFRPQHVMYMEMSCSAGHPGEPF